MKQTFALILAGLLFAVGAKPVLAEVPVYRFGIANFQSNLESAAQLNPILAWVGQRAGVKLELKAGYSFDDMQRHLARGEYDFYLGFPSLQPAVFNAYGYQIIAAMRDRVRVMIAVQDQSIYHSLKDLAGKEIGMGDRNAFFTYIVPMAHLLNEGVAVKAKRIGNQQAMIAEFKMEHVQAMAVTEQAFKAYMKDSQLAYRTLWRSDYIAHYPLSVQRHVPKSDADKVRAAFVAMADDPEGQAILAKVNQRKGLTWAGWENADDETYRFAIEAYRVMGKLAATR